MIQKIQNFFLELQQGDEDTKKRWLVILTSGSMLAVILLWTVYLNFTIENLNAPSKKSNEAGFLKTSQVGLQVISKEIGLKLSEVAAYLNSIAKQTNSITLEAANVSLILKDLESVTPRRLP